MRGDGEFVELSYAKSRYEELVNAAVCDRLHRGCIRIPGVEVADQADGGCVRRPDREIVAVLSAICIRVCAQLVVELVVAAFSEEIPVKLADHAESLCLWFFRCGSFSSGSCFFHKVTPP